MAYACGVLPVAGALGGEVVAGDAIAQQVQVGLVAELRGVVVAR